MATVVNLPREIPGCLTFLLPATARGQVFHWKLRKVQPSFAAPSGSDSLTEGQIFPKPDSIASL